MSTRQAVRAALAGRGSPMPTAAIVRRVGDLAEREVPEDEVVRTLGGLGCDYDAATATWSLPADTEDDEPA